MALAHLNYITEFATRGSGIIGRISASATLTALINTDSLDRTRGGVA